MTKQSLYLAPLKDLWTGRDDGADSPRIFQKIQHLDLASQSTIPQGHQSIAFLGFASDAGVARNLGRVGASEGPNILKRALANLPLHRDDLKFFDAGSVICQGDALELAQSALAEKVALLLENNFLPVLLGGGHEIAWGHYQGIKKAQFNKQLHILNIDAHFDLRPLVNGHAPSSGTPFLQIAQDCQEQQLPFHYHCVGIQEAGNTSSLFNKAQDLQVHSLTAGQCYASNPEEISKSMSSAWGSPRQTYLTICLDAFSSAYAPGVSAPQPLGLSPWQMIPMLESLARSGSLLTVDIAELSPKYDINSTTANLGAQLVHRILHALP